MNPTSQEKGDTHHDSHKITGLQHTRLSYLQRPVGVAPDHHSLRAALADLPAELPERSQLYAPGPGLASGGTIREHDQPLAPLSPQPLNRVPAHNVS